jgi:NAD-dependent SIR2 family protein deacetylase
MKIFRIYCEECLNEYEIQPINEPVDEIEPKVCPMCKSKIDEWFYDDDEDDL